jgi:hypothetical protein
VCVDGVFSTAQGTRIDDPRIDQRAPCEIARLVETYGGGRGALAEVLHVLQHGKPN